jgi:hypothetical protein
MTAVFRDAIMRSDRVFTSQVSGEDRMCDAPMLVPHLTVMVVSLWMNVEKGKRDRPEDAPEKDNSPEIRLVMGLLCHSRFSIRC